MSSDGIEKRSRLACDPCRRKKIKCPNQRPSCSSCTRLGQTCTYRRSAQTDGAMEERMAQLEARLYDFTREGGQISNSTTQDEQASAMTDLGHGHNAQGRPIQIGSKYSPSAASINSALQCYFERCHKQPIWLFGPEEVGDPSSLADELALALLALTSLFPSSQSSDQYQGYLQSARSIVMSQVAAGSVRLSTIESLCIISQACFQGLWTFFHTFLIVY